MWWVFFFFLTYFHIYWNKCKFFIIQIIQSVKKIKSLLTKMRQIAINRGHTWCVYNVEGMMRVKYLLCSNACVVVVTCSRRFLFLNKIWFKKKEKWWKATLNIDLLLQSAHLGAGHTCSRKDFIGWSLNIHLPEVTKYSLLMCFFFIY